MVADAGPPLRDTPHRENWAGTLSCIFTAEVFVSLIAKLEKQIAAGAKPLIVEEVDLPALVRELDALPEPDFVVSKDAGNGVICFFRGVPLIAEGVAEQPKAPKAEAPKAKAPKVEALKAE